MTDEPKSGRKPVASAFTDAGSKGIFLPESGAVPHSGEADGLFGRLPEQVREDPLDGSSDPPVTGSTGKPASPHAGHRQRLRERILAGGGASMADYELLEMILFGAIARGDTKPLAKRLIDRFGSLSEVIQAEDARLREVKGVGPAVICELRLVREAALRLLRTEVRDQPVLSSWQKVVDYCRAAMAREPIEQFRVLYLDKKNRLIGDEVQSQGTVDHTPVYIREVMKRALENSATAIILVHNHPSGDPTPSRADVDMTNQIVTAAKPFGILVHDHIIVSRDGHASFRSLGLLR